MLTNNPTIKENISNIFGPKQVMLTNNPTFKENISNIFGPRQVMLTNIVRLFNVMILSKLMQNNFYSHSHLGFY
jgi:hypothetical protein